MFFFLLLENNVSGTLDLLFRYLKFLFFSSECIDFYVVALITYTASKKHIVYSATKMVNKSK